MPLSSPIQSKEDLLYAIENLPDAVKQEIPQTHDIQSPESLSFTPNILDSWAKGEYLTVNGALLCPSLANLSDANFYAMRQYLRDRLFALTDESGISGYTKLVDKKKYQYPALRIVDKKVRVFYFRTFNDCKNDIQTETTPARYLVANGVDEGDARVAAEALAARFDAPVYSILTDSEEISKTFVRAHNGLRSCMTKPASAFGLPDHLHPTAGHGYPGELALAILWDGEEKKKMTARCMVWPKEKIFGRCYGLTDKLANALIADGWTFGNFYGAKIALPVFGMEKCEGREVNLKHLMPYIDVVDEERDDFGNHRGAMHWFATQRGVFVHEGTAYLEAELIRGDTHADQGGGFTITPNTTNHHSTGVARTSAYYYPSKDKIYIADRTRFVHMKGRLKPRRFDVSELIEAGYENSSLASYGGTIYTKDMMYTWEDKHGYRTPIPPSAMLEMYNNSGKIHVLPNGTAVFASLCAVAKDTGNLELKKNLFREITDEGEQYVSRRKRYLGTIYETRSERSEIVTAAKIEHLMHLLRETPDGQLTINQTDFDDSETEHRTVNPTPSNPTVRWRIPIAN